MGRAKSFIYGFTIGGLAAGVSVLLNTPQSGKNMRRDLQEKWDDMNTSVSDLKVAYNQAKMNITQLKSKGLPLVRSTINDIKRFSNTWKTELEPNLRRLLKESQRLENLTNRGSNSSESND
jgi:gas vesicle protein